METASECMWLTYSFYFPLRDFPFHASRPRSFTSLALLGCNSCLLRAPGIINLFFPRHPADAANLRLFLSTLRFVFLIPYELWHDMRKGQSSHRIRKQKRKFPGRIINIPAFLYRAHLFASLDAKASGGHAWAIGI